MAKTFRATTVCFLMLVAGGCAESQSAIIDSQSPISDKPISYSAMRYEATVRQLADFTCGAASLATVLTYYWGAPTTEKDVMDVLRQRYTDKELKIKSHDGLSFDDLIFAAHQLGFEAQGAKVSLEQLGQLAGPAIVHLNKGSFQHFVVLRKVGDEVYYVSDPVVGQLAMDTDEFKKQFTGDVLAIWKKQEPLPKSAKLTNPRDGINVDNTLWSEINAQPTHFLIVH